MEEGLESLGKTTVTPRPREGMGRAEGSGDLWKEAPAKTSWSSAGCMAAVWRVEGKKGKESFILFYFLFWD